MVSNGTNRPIRLRIVGTAVLPAVGANFSQHLEMGTGAVLATRLIPSFDKDPLGDPVTGRNAILVCLRRGASVASLEQIAIATSTTADGGVSVVGVQRPAEIINYEYLGSTPALLGGSLAIGASSLSA